MSDADPDLGRRRDRRHDRRLLAPRRPSTCCSSTAAADHVDGHQRAMACEIDGPIESFTQVPRPRLPDEVEGRSTASSLREGAAHRGGARRAGAASRRRRLCRLGPERAQRARHRRHRRRASARSAASSISAPTSWRRAWSSTAAAARSSSASSTARSDAARSRLHALLLQIFEPDAMLTDNIWGYLWGKLVYGALLFATALTDESMTADFADPARVPAWLALGREVAAVADAPRGDAARLRRLRAGGVRAGSARGRGARRDRLAWPNTTAQSAKTHSRHLARSRGPQAPDRGRRPDRGHRRAGARAGHPDAGARSPRRPDPRGRGRAAPAIARHLQRASSRHAASDFDARAVIVTGAAQGFGRAIAKAFRDAGASVHVADLDAAGVRQAAEALGRDRACRSTSPIAHRRIGSSPEWLRPRAGSTSWRSTPAACAARSAGRSRRFPKPIGGCSSRPMSTARSGSPRPRRRS